MNLNSVFHYSYVDSRTYLKLAEATCLRRRRAAALYLHAASRPAYLLCVITSLVGALIVLASAYLTTPNTRPLLSPSQQSGPFTEESRTPRGYPRRYFLHVVKRGDTYGKLVQHYYDNLHDRFKQHYGEEKTAWKVIQAENPRPNEPPFEEKDIPVAIELKIPLP